jgi:hypothetical protein
MAVTVAQDHLHIVHGLHQLLRALAVNTLAAAGVVLELLAIMESQLLAVVTVVTETLTAQTLLLIQAVVVVVREQLHQAGELQAVTVVQVWLL